MTVAVVLVVALIVAVALPVVRRLASADRIRRRVETVGAGAANTGGVATPPVWFETAWTALDASGPYSSTTVWPIAVLASVGAAMWAALYVPEVIVVCLVLGAAVVATRRPLARRRANGGYEADLLAALAGVASSLGGGASLGHALHRASSQAGACGADLARARTRIEAGWSVQSALDHWAASRSEPAVLLVADALAVAGTAGASQERAITAVAATIRDRADRGREVRALASQAKASCAVLVATPVAFSVVVSLLDGRVLRFLLGTAAGWGCMLGGLLLDGVGAWWMARLVRRVR